MFEVADRWSSGRIPEKTGCREDCIRGVEWRLKVDAHARTKNELGLGGGKKPGGCVVSKWLIELKRSKALELPP